MYAANKNAQPWNTAVWDEQWQYIIYPFQQNSTQIGLLQILESAIQKQYGL